MTSTSGTCLRLTPTRSRRARKRGTPRAVRFKVPDGTVRVDDLVQGRDRVRRVAHRRLRHPAIRRPPDVSPVGRRRRCRDGDHACRPRRRSHLEHAEADSALPGARRAAAEVRARAADSRRGQEAAEQAARRDVGDGVRAPGLPARGDGEFSRAARLVAGRRRREVFTQRRAGGDVRSRGHQRRQRRVQSREARLVQPAASRAACARRSWRRG